MDNRGTYYTVCDNSSDTCACTSGVWVIHMSYPSDYPEIIPDITHRPSRTGLRAGWIKSQQEDGYRAWKSSGWG